jgi:hypothetical protein
LQLSTELVGESDARVDEILTGTDERLQCQCLVTGGGEHGEAVTVGSSELAQHERVEAVVLAGGRAVSVTRCLDLVGVDREHDDPGRKQPSDQEPVGALNRTALHAVAEQQRDQRADGGLVVAELLSSEQLPVLVSATMSFPRRLIHNEFDLQEIAEQQNRSIELRRGLCIQPRDGLDRQLAVNLGEPFEVVAILRTVGEALESDDAAQPGDEELGPVSPRAHCPLLDGAIVQRG